MTVYEKSDWGCMAFAVLVFAAFIAILAGPCQPGIQKEFKEKTKTRFRREKFEGHSYIIVWDRVGRCGGMTHDPDCEKCRRAKSISK